MNFVTGSQAKINGTRVAAGNAKWGDLGGGRMGFIFPEKEAMRFMLSPSRMTELGISTEDLMNVVGEVEKKYSAYLSDRFGSMGFDTNKGFYQVGLVAEHPTNARLRCLFTPTDDDTGVAGYFQWYFDNDSSYAADGVKDYVNSFDKMIGNRTDRILNSPIMPSYEEASIVVSQIKCEGLEDQDFLQKIWNYHRFMKRGGKLNMEQEIGPKWAKMKELYEKQQVVY